MGEWTTTRLGHFVRLQRGHDLPEPSRRPGHVPVVGSFGVTGWHDESRAPGPGVTVGRSGASFGVASYVSQPYWPLNTALYVTDFMGNSARFTYYLLDVLDLSHLNTGSAQPSLNRNHVHELLLEVPPVPEQRAIAAALEVLDDRIELNRRMAATLEEMARALFKSWFVDFDPVRAKAEGRDTGLPSEIADLFPDRLVDSDLGEIPDGWVTGVLSDVATLQQRTIDPGRQPESIWHHFSIPAFDASRAPSMDLGETIKSGKYAVPADAVLISKLNPSTPRVWMVDVSDPSRSVCSTEFLPFRPRSSVERPFLFDLLRSEPMEVAIASRVTGSTGSRQRVLPSSVAAVPCIVPPQRLRLSFSAIAGPWQARMQSLVRKSATLAELRDALLPKLVSGEIRIADPDDFLARVEAVG